MLNAFSIPQSAPNPASVTTYPACSHLTSPGSVPASFSAILSAIIDEFPCAILAKGPAWTKTGVPWKLVKQEI